MIYTVKTKLFSISDCKCECDCGCKTIVIVGIVFGILGAIGLLINVVGIPAGFFGERTPLLVSGGIGIVCDVISLVLSAVVKECCEGNCKDSECCEDSKCCEDWIKHSAIAFIVIPCLAIVPSVVIFILVFLNRIGPGNNDGNIGNNGDHHGHGPNSSTVHSEREDTHRGTLSDRTKTKEKRPLEKLANSDGEVSRKDVHVQENRDNFSGRPMPPIPLTDKKGRGLSANYDDDHPMITVGIPDKRAGDLGPLDEEPRKKKKKKKKAVNDDDDE
ncbi:uncharacterized protein LOC132721719 [Ruditapes philippinarum]|uniref:uncharacterized protein LOC132721719 n=1 Tax=Ruditapes philippinarum TaxID=129788 RepID=UPI00295B0042|nr:uncharacterized protein LOC132721719 [Ruditapes philippinarum]